jgi:hypothetical protein
MHLVMMPVGLFPTRRTRGRADVPPAFTFRRFLFPPRFIEQEPNQILPAQALSARGSQTSSGAVLLGTTSSIGQTRGAVQQGLVHCGPRLITREQSKKKELHLHIPPGSSLQVGRSGYSIN